MSLDSRRGDREVGADLARGDHLVALLAAVDDQVEEAIGHNGVLGIVFMLVRSFPNRPVRSYKTSRQSCTSKRESGGACVSLGKRHGRHHQGEDNSDCGQHNDTRNIKCDSNMRC